MKRRDLHRELEQAGRGPLPSADPLFAESLERRLRSAHEQLRADAERPRLVTATTPRRVAVHRPWIFSPIPVAAALVLLLTVSVSTFLRAPAPGGVELLAAYDATVQRPDGSTEPARAGLRLQEGAVVLTGPDGHVTVGKTRIGPRQIAVVRDKRLKPVQGSPPLPAPSQSPQATAAPPAGQPAEQPPVSLPGSRPRPVREPVAPPPTASEAPTDAPQPIDKPSERPSPSRSPRPSPSPTFDQQPQDKVVVGRAAPTDTHRIGLASKAQERRVELAWTEVRHPAFAFFVILRAPGPEAPQWPPAGRTELVGRSNTPDQRHFVDAQVPYRPVYRIVAVDRDGRELARSAAVTPGTRAQPSSATSSPAPEPPSETPSADADSQVGLSQPALPPSER